MYLSKNKKPLLYYNPDLGPLARKLRNNCTLAEVLVWNCIKNNQVRGLKFHRQKPIGNYIVDFFCYEKMLAIEIDGESHEYKKEYDNKRTAYLNSLGIKILRFIDKEIKENPSGIIVIIEEWLDANR
jgi:very-short-patch-repair endonuclease